MNCYRILFLTAGLLPAMGCDVRNVQLPLTLGRGGETGQVTVDDSSTNQKGLSAPGKDSFGHVGANAETAVAPVSHELAAFNLAFREVKLELQLRTETDAVKRAELESDISHLRERRQALYQQQHEGQEK